jgi:hypothetical protein
MASKAKTPLPTKTNQQIAEEKAWKDYQPRRQATAEAFGGGEFGARAVAALEGGRSPRTGSSFGVQRPASLGTSAPGAAAAPGYGEMDQSQLTASYQKYIDKQNKEFSRFTAEQRANISAIQARNTASINNQLGAIEAGAASSYSNFSNVLNTQMDQSKSMNLAYRNHFAKENAQAESDIDVYQRQIKGLTGPTYVDQMTTGPETVSGWDSLGKIGVDQGAIKLNRGRTQTGASTSQQQSRARQKVGIQGLRRGV